MRGITRDAFVEMVDRKAPLIMLPAMLAGVVAVLTSDWTKLQISFADVAASSSHAAGVSEIALHFLATYMSLLTPLIVLLVAGVFPEMLRPDRAWFYFAKPLSRSKLIVEKISAVLVVYIGLLLIAVLPAVILGILRYELYDSRIGLIILLHLFNATMWVIMVASFGMLLRSPGRAILAGASVWAIQQIFIYREAIIQRLDLPYVGALLNAVNYIIPRTTELSRAAHRLASGGTTDVLLPIFTTLLFTLLLLYSGTAAVARRDL
jgi:hypothetical protein